MAAIRSGVTSSLARCLLPKTEKLNRGSHPMSNIWNHRLLQRSLLHIVFEGRSAVVRPPLRHRRHGKFFWVNAVAVRYNSLQIPTEDGAITAPVVEASGFPVSLPANSPPITAPQLPQQSPAETVSMAVGNTAPSPPPPLDPSLVLTQPVTEQVADITPTAVEVLQAAATEPSLTELGLCASTPVGLIQNFLEFLHVGVGLPWWGAIAAGTILVRGVLFPLILKGQREAAKLNNFAPELNKLSEKMKEAKQSGNSFEFSKAHTDLVLFQKKHDINLLRSLQIPMVQIPVFLSFFIALRKMADLPVPSLQTGGALWFMDLTTADPFYVLPLVATGSLFLVVKLGAETGLSNPQMQKMKIVTWVMPFIILPFILNFPAALFVYWVTSNTLSLGQVALLNQPMIRDKLRIPERIKHPITTRSDSDGFIESVKKGWKNVKMAHELQERERRIRDSEALAAKGPLRQTFSTPIKKTQTTAASAMRKKAGKKAKPWSDTLY